MTHNPTMLRNRNLTPGSAPKYGVSDSQSVDFSQGSSWVFAWFVNIDDAKRFAYRADNFTNYAIWDLEAGILV